MQQLTEQHQGKIIEAAIKEAGYQMKAVAKGLGIARNTLYKKLKEAALEDSFIIQVSNIIHYDFSKVFPEVYQRAAAKIDHHSERLYIEKSGKGSISYELPHYETAYKNPYFLQLHRLRGKHLKLMEDYHKLLKVLILLANDNELIDIKQEIVEFLTHEEQEG